MCAVRFCLVSLALLAPCPLIAFARADENKVVVAPIIKSEISEAYYAMADMGSADAGEVLHAEVRLVNTTPKLFRFDAFSTSCSCTDVSPSKGHIPPGDSLTVRFKVQTILRPNQSQVNGMIAFMDGQDIAFESRFRYGFDAYVGFKTNLAVVEWDGAGSESFTLPMFLGSDVDEEQVAVTTAGFDCLVETKLDLSKPALACKLSPNQGGASSLGLITVENRATGVRSSCRIVVESASPIKVFPKRLRFVKDSEKDGLRGVFYIVNDDEDVLDATLAIRGRVYRCAAERTSGPAKQFVVRIPIQDSEGLLPEEGEQTLWVDSKLRIQLRGDSLSLTVPCFFGETK